MLFKSLDKLLGVLDDMIMFISPTSPIVAFAADAEESIINSIITDKNYLGFHYYIYMLYIKRAERAAMLGEHEQAICFLKTARASAESFDELFNSDKRSFACPLLSGCEREWRVEEELRHDSVDHWKLRVGGSAFDPIRDTQELMVLLE